ncbi:MAG: tRNA pseudouridine(55) synthase TruB, partial [Pseudomonadota bacterium]
QALQRVKRLFDARKAGHTGSLDPLATGLLPICFGHATKISTYLLDADKRYEVDAAFGAQTDTGDADGAVIKTCEPALSRDALEAALPSFHGPVDQVPPMYSALKHQGRRLYELAREGVSVERPARRITIHSLTCEGVDGHKATLTVQCSKGTYVRTLVEDVAASMGSLAHVARLRRTGVGPFTGKTMWTLEALTERAEAAGIPGLDELLLPVDAALEAWPSVSLTADAAHFFANGQPVQAPGAPADVLIRTYGGSGQFLGIGQVTGDGRLGPKRLFR